MRVILVLLLLSISTFAKEQCTIDKKILYSILLNESLPQRAGYENIISFNNTNDAKRAKTVYSKYFVNARTLDCKNKKLCVGILTHLTRSNIKNLDVGAFQINYKFHKLDADKYFSYKDSYKYACEFISDLIKEHGYNWYAIASYHSKTPKYNLAYQKKLIQNYKLISLSMN